VFCRLVVLVRLSVPVQEIDWTDSSPKWPMLMGTLNPTHSLTYSLYFVCCVCDGTSAFAVCFWELILSLFLPEYNTVLLRVWTETMLAATDTCAVCGVVTTFAWWMSTELSGQAWLAAWCHVITNTVLPWSRYLLVLFYHLHQRSLFSSAFVCLFISMIVQKLFSNCSTDFHKIQWKDGT